MTIQVNVLNVFNNHTFIYEDRISVVENGTAQDHDFENVTSMDIFEEDGDLQIRLGFSDGFSTKVFGASLSESEDWAGKYAGRTEYAAFLAEQFKGRGVTFSVSDEEELRKCFESKGLEGLEELLSIVK